MRLFLQGERGIGKSSLLRRVLLPYVGSLRGFVVQRLMEDGRQTGFRAVTLENGFPPLEAPYLPDLPSVFILHGKSYIPSLEETLVRVGSAAKNPRCKLLLLDEIGGIELASPRFMDALHRILESGKPCIGVLKSKGNLAHAAYELELGKGYAALHHNLEQWLRKEGTLLTLERHNRDIIWESVQDFLAGLNLKV